MSDDSVRPVPNDPSAVDVQGMLDVADSDWWLLRVGDYETSAVEGMKRDGSDWQLLIALTLPVRRNRGDEEATVRVLVSPEDAAGIVDALTHTLAWLDARRTMGN